MNAVVADTHTFIWYASRNPLLSASAHAALLQAEQTNNPIFIPTIVVVELRYLVEKRTLTEQECQDLITTLKDPTTAPTVAPLDLLAAEMLEQIPRAVVPDMPDRIIAATALALGFPLVTRDHKIQMLTNIQTIW